MATTRLTIILGLSQLVSWGISYYMPAVLGDAIATSLAVSANWIYAGPSLALLVMGVTSIKIGRLIDHYGGRRVMVTGAILMAMAFLGFRQSQGLISYYSCWVLMGLAMRMSLYEAAFAALVRASGPDVQPVMARITLFGGLASTVFWPLGQSLLAHLGWRDTLAVYALVALWLIPLLWQIPDHVHQRRPAIKDTLDSVSGQRPSSLPGGLYMLMTTLTAFLSNGMSMYMIAIFISLGLSAETAVWLAALRGISQTVARLFSSLMGTALSPLLSAILASAVLCVGFVPVSYFHSSLAMLGFLVIAFGAGIGTLTIVRGSIPLLLFDSTQYGAFTGTLLAPSFILSALAPLLFGMVISHFGQMAALRFSLLLALLILLSAVALQQWVYRYRLEQ